MNRHSDDSAHCPPRVITHVFASEPCTKHDTESVHENEELMCDYERDGDNQDDSELYHPDGDGGDFNELAAETSSLASSDNSSFVWSEQGTITAVRVRPMLPLEKKSNYRVIVGMSMNNDGLVTRIVNPTALPPPSRSHASARYTAPLMESPPATDSANFPAQFTQEFRFDYSYWSFDHSSANQVATQSTIYDELGVLALQSVLQGHNCSVFAYGQPGAGKTYTIMGGSGERTSLAASVRANNSGGNNVRTPSTLAASEQRGLIPRICQGLFAEIDEGKNSGYAYALIMSYVEIYDERVYDLLSQASSKQSLKVREHPEDGAFVERAQRVHVTSYTQILDLIEEGNRSRSVTSTHNSGRPTRSHTVLILSLTQNTLADSTSMASTTRSFETLRKNKICLVDLAGSERVDHSGGSGLRLREAANVNRSLATLADVVSALAKRKCNRSVDGSQQQKAFVPYRNSVLTRLLRKGLGGRAKTIMIGAISPCCAHYEESIATLRCIERARSVYSIPRLQVDTSGATTRRFLDGAIALKSNLCASNEVKIPPAIADTCCGAPEHHDECLGCETCEQRLSYDSPAEILQAQTPLVTNAQHTSRVKESKFAGLEAAFCEHENNFHVQSWVDRTRQEQTAGVVPRKIVHLLNLITIRRGWETLQKYHAFDRWRKLVSLDANALLELRVKQEKPGTSKRGGQIESNFALIKSNDRKTVCPPLHTRTSTAETRTIARVQDVVAAVVATDAICCSVVQEFLYPHQTNATKLSIQQSSRAASTTLLELLASSSEYDRSEFCFDLSGDCSENEHRLDELASTEDWCCAKEEELTWPTELDELTAQEELEPVEHIDIASPLWSPRPHDEGSTIHSALSLCVDSIDMARRVLGPGMRSLRSRSTAIETGVECELLRYLDKRFVVITRCLEDVMMAFQAQPDANSTCALSPRSCCESLEAMVGEFCLQIIARLCAQLPSASSACVAGRFQLETQLEHFTDRLKLQLVQVPEMARSGNGFEANERVHAVFFVATELLVMTERIKLVWNLAGHKKRERLLQTQALEVAAINDRKMTAQIAALEERNAELSARCDALAALSARLDEPMTNGAKVSHGKDTNRIPTYDDKTYPTITLEQLEIEYDGVIASKPEHSLGAQLAVKLARTLDVQARNDELLCQFATVNRELAAASARVTALEAENSRLSSGVRSSIVDISENDSTNNPTLVQALRDRVTTLPKELENAHVRVHDLEDQLIGLQSTNLEQYSELKSIKTPHSCEKEARNSSEAEFSVLRTQGNTQILETRSQLSATVAPARELEDVEVDKSEPRWQTANEALVDTEAKNPELSTSLMQTKAELQSALKRTCQAENESNQYLAMIENLTMSLYKLQAQLESTQMRAEDSVSRHVALMEHNSVQADEISVLKKRVCLDKQRLQEVELQLATAGEDKDEHVLLLSHSEDALASALDREKLLQSQLVAASARELEEMNRLREELHEATLELTSLREELTELLDHSTLQSATVETVNLELTVTSQRARELELERDELMLRCQTDQDASEQKERKLQVLAHQSAEKLSRLERQQEIERQESMAVIETLQRQTDAFLKFQARQHSSKTNYCSIIRDLKAQIETLSAESQAVSDVLAAQANEINETHSAAEAQIQKFEEQVKLSESLFHKQEESSRSLAGQLQEYRVDLNGSTHRWIRAETQCGLLRICIKRLNCYLTESKEACMMQLADAESSRFRDDSGHISTRVTGETKLAVNEDLNSLDTWFNEMISGNQVTTETLSTHKTSAMIIPENTQVIDKTRDGDFASRSSLLRTLTDLSALTNELLVVCESTSDAGTRSNNLSTEECNHTRKQHDAKVDTDGLELQTNDRHETIKKVGEMQAIEKHNKKTSGEVVQLRKIVMQLKEALNAKDDMLHFLDGKVRRLEAFVQNGAS